jgi:FtsZ-interacting cell division protein ZipA
MSNLQIGLAIAGGVVLAAVVAHSTWTSRKNKPRQADPVDQETLTESGSTSSASFDGPLEPAFESTPGYPRSNPDTPTVSLQQTSLSHDPVNDMALAMMQEATMHAQREPNAADLARIAADKAKAAERAAEEKRAQATQSARAIAAPDLIPVEKRLSLDALIDVIAAIEIEHPISGEATIAAMPATRRVGNKLFILEALHTETGLWEQPRNSQRYSAFQAGVQLANRMGALNEIEFSEFVLKIQHFSDTVNGAPEFPDMLDEVARARELDNFASAHDAQLSFTIKAVKTAWSPGYVQQNAARLGFVAGVIPGRMVVPAPAVGLPPILGLTFDAQAAMSEDPTQSAIWELTLSLDVPQVDRQEEPFARMVHTADELARVMDGAVTDDNGQALSQAAIASISKDLQALYDTLDARDLSAGSVQARRLFS